MYTETGRVEEAVLAGLRAMLVGAEWDYSNPQGDFGVWRPEPGVIHRLFPQSRDNRDSFFLCIHPGGHVHRHRDSVKPYQTYHVPVLTNERSICWSDDKPYVLEVGKIYHVDRTLLHWSTNDGETDRVHLLLAIDPEVGDDRQ